MKVVVFTDADNTLWDTDGVYAAAQRWLISAVSTEMGIQRNEDDPLELVRRYDQAIASGHHAGLRYPPQLLVRALTMALSGVDPTKAAKRVWAGNFAFLAHDKVSALEAEFLSRLEKKPRLRVGVHEGLSLLAKLSLQPIVLTEGYKARCEDYLEHFGLEKYVGDVYEVQKTVALYRRFMRLMNADRPFMIGDQLDRDIALAERAGFSGILFPGGFRPKWVNEQETSKATRVVDSYLEAARIIEESVFSYEDAGHKHVECS